VIVGKLLSETAELKLHYGHTQKSFTQTVKLGGSNSLGANEVIPRIWATKKSDYLWITAQGCYSGLVILFIKDFITADESKDEVVNLGRKFGIVTPNTSLLVLTTFEQVCYNQHFTYERNFFCSI
jgi:hypothetical protein